MNTDLGLAKSYFANISSKQLQIKDLNGNYVDSDSYNLYKFISAKLKPQVRESYFARFAPDKEIETILNKISRKHQDAKFDMIPYYYNLIKDPKRLSLVFESKKELFTFVEELKSDNLFGSGFVKELHYEESQILIRIKEIKNGFKRANKGAYQDLKVIFEYYVEEKDIAFQMECQCNLDTFIKWKKSEHLLYDYDRAADDYETVINNFKEYRWQESSTRMTLRVIRNLIKLISGIILLYLYAYISYQAYTDRYFINHYNKRYQAGFVQGLADDVCLYGVGYNNYICIGESDLGKSMNYFSFKQIKNSHLIDDYYYILDNNKIVSNDKAIEKSENDYDFKENHIEVSEEFLVGIENENLISIYNKQNNQNNQNNQKMSHLKSISILISGWYHSCISNVYKTICWGRSDYNQINVPEEFKNGGLDLLSAGYLHTCGQNENSLKCWGKNKVGSTDVPDVFQNGGLDLLTSGAYHNCGQNDKYLKCWGLSDYNQINVPVEFFYGGLDLLSAGYHHSCGQNENLLKCWGRNREGSTDVPEEFENGGLDLLISGSWHNCGQNENLLKCWGRNIEGSTDVPEEFKNGGLNLLSAGYANTCGQNENSLKCWGRSRYEIKDVPKEFKNGGLDLFSFGESFACGQNETLLKCWGYEGRNSLDLPSDAYLQIIDIKSDSDFKNIYSLSKNNYVCQKMSNSIICYKINERGYFYYKYIKNVNPEMMCIYQSPHNNDNAILAYVDKADPDRIKRIPMQVESTPKPDLEKGKITSLKCGSMHMCWINDKGKSGCVDGSYSSKESVLTKEMESDVLEIYAGKHRTCVLKLGKIICNGYPIKQTTMTSLAEIE